MGLTSRTRKRIVWSAAIIAGLILLLGFLGPLISYKEIRNSICPVCGSTRSEIIWFGHFKQEKRTITALESWLKRREPGFEPAWQHLSTQTYFILGRSCGTAGTPVIHQLRPILDEVVDKSSDDKLAALVAVLRHGSRDEQRKMIQNISDEVFERK
jgi:formate dehydrogenase maturation protein FdhE